MNSINEGLSLGLGFSDGAVPVLQRLEQAGMVDTIRWPGESANGGGSAGPWLAQHWNGARRVVAVGACGLVTRLIAPLLGSKHSDPAVLVIDPSGKFVVPLLGGHAADAEDLAVKIAALLGAEAVLTSASAGAERLALDAFGRAWGWQRSETGDWNRLMAKASAGETVTFHQEGGTRLWQELEAGRFLMGVEEEGGPDLRITPHEGAGCRWHPPCLWLGMGCERHTSLEVLERLVDRELQHHGLAAASVAGLASIDRKGDEPALLALANRRGWALKLFRSEELAGVPVPHPSDAVAREMGTASVAEAAALLAAGATPAPETTARLLIGKTIEHAGAQERGAATLAVALDHSQWRAPHGQLHLVGSGPGSLDLLSADARVALAGASIWVGYGLYLDLLEPLRRPDQLRREGRLTEERARCAEALALASQGLNVALISSGDSGIYGMAGLALELWLQQPLDQRPGFSVHPGVSALQLAAARAGAPLMHDFCTVSLSDRLTPWDVIERRLRAAAAGDFVVALYNPRSQGRDWQLGQARELLLQERPGDTPVLIARQLGRREEELSLHTLADLPLERVDMLTLVLIGNSSTYVQDGLMVTPRGYPGAALA